MGFYSSNYEHQFVCFFKCQRWGGGMSLSMGFCCRPTYVQVGVITTLWISLFPSEIHCLLKRQCQTGSRRGEKAFWMASGLSVD